MLGSGDDQVKLVECAIESEEGLDDEITDAMLGGLRRGILSIRNNAKETLEQCSTGESRVHMEHVLKSETIKLLRCEKSFLETARVVADIVEEISSDFEADEYECVETKAAGDIPQKSSTQNDASENPLHELPATNRRISVFRPTMANIDSIGTTAKLMAEMFTDRIKSYEDSLTDVMLEDHPKFKALQKQINLVEPLKEKEEIDKLMTIPEIKAALSLLNPSMQDQQNDDDDTETGSEDNIMMMLEDFGDDFDTILKAALKPDVIYASEEFDVDYSILPSVDPISRQPIVRALKNKFCNHIFEETSIRGFMSEDPEARCPMYGCTNSRRLEPEHLIFDPILNHQIKEKHYRF